MARHPDIDTLFATLLTDLKKGAELAKKLLAKKDMKALLAPARWALEVGRIDLAELFQAAGRDAGRKLMEIKHLREKGHRISLLSEATFWRLVRSVVVKKAVVSSQPRAKKSSRDR